MPEVRRNVAWLTISVRHRRVGMAPGRASAWHRAARRHGTGPRVGMRSMPASSASTDRQTPRLQWPIAWRSLCAR